MDIRHHFIKEQVERKVVSEVVFRGDKIPTATYFLNERGLTERALRKITTTSPLLGVKQMSPETLKELLDSVCLSSELKQPHRLQFKTIAVSIILSGYSKGLVSIAHLDIVYLFHLTPHYVAREIGYI
ncbi:hypothetical protein Tco_0311831 [Tanacetum coccineum]